MQMLARAAPNILDVNILDVNILDVNILVVRLHRTHVVPSLNGKETKRNRFGCDKIYGKVIGKAQREAQPKVEKKGVVEPGRVR